MTTAAFAVVRRPVGWDCRGSRRRFRPLTRRRGKFVEFPPRTAIARPAEHVRLRPLDSGWGSVGNPPREVNFAKAANCWSAQEKRGVSMWQRRTPEFELDRIGKVARKCVEHKKWLRHTKRTHERCVVRRMNPGRKTRQHTPVCGQGH